jgi:Cu(I)/Ag(I) efflux system membrane fusion protein/cobalt-zinc-cadmium efflux system membrane fusion protein
MNANRIKIIILSAIILALILGLAGGYLIGKKSESEPESIQSVSGEKQLYSCGMHPQIIQEGPGNCPICGMKLTPVRSGAVTPSGERKIKYWRSPHDPNFISDKPRKDQMGMDFIPVYEDEVQQEAISIDPVTVQNMGLRTDVAKKQKLSRTIRTVGHIDYNEELLYTVNTKISGWIEKLYVDKTGEIVKRGQPLLEIYAPELVSTQQEYLLAVKNYEYLKESAFSEAKRGAEQLLESTRKRLLYWDIALEQIERLERTKEVQKTLTLFAPADGVVTEKNVTDGARMEAGMDLFKVAGLSMVWVLAHVYEYELPYVQIGQKAFIESPYLPGDKREGKVTYIYPYLDQTARDVKVRIEVPNPGLKLKPEMYTNVSIASELSGEKVVIPEEAVLRSGKREIVFLDLGEGKFMPKEVVTGVSGEGNVVEIKQGLSAGDRIVVSAQFMLDSESKTQEAIKKMLETKQTSVTTKEPVKEESAEMKEEKHQQGNLNLTPDKKAHSANEVYTCPMEEHSHILQVGPGDCPECGMKLISSTEAGRKVYSCPMEEHHHVLSDKPGKCSECGMDLVPLSQKTS